MLISFKYEKINDPDDDVIEWNTHSLLHLPSLVAVLVAVQSFHRKKEQHHLFSHSFVWLEPKGHNALPFILMGLK